MDFTNKNETKVGQCWGKSGNKIELSVLGHHYHRYCVLRTKACDWQRLQHGHILPVVMFKYLETGTGVIDACIECFCFFYQYLDWFYLCFLNINFKTVARTKFFNNVQRNENEQRQWTMIMNNGNEQS